MTFKEAWDASSKKMKAAYIFAFQGLAIDLAIAAYIIYKVFN